jgi:hypothetical protein
MNVTHPGSRRRNVTAAVAAVLGLAAALAPAGCSRAKTQAPALACALVELRPDVASQYYDAVVRLESVTIKGPRKENFQVLTPSSSFDLAALKFTVEGADPGLLEPGDTFVIPLKRPDWKFSLYGGETEYCAERFWDRLPVDDRWHPTRTEAMDVARSLEVTSDHGVAKPLPTLIPPEWRLVNETEPGTDNPVGSLLYQKLRGGRTVEQVEVQYSQLTQEQQAQLEATSPAAFLSSWSDCAKNGGAAVDIAGHSAVACDLEGEGEFGWTYRFFYVSEGLVIAADVQADPEELGKTDQEKEAERRTKEVFLRYGYGPVGPEGWQVMIELRMDRTGAFHKRSRAGETVDKEFKVSDEEFAAVEKALADNAFMALESRSGAGASSGAGLESFIAVRSSAGDRTVNMKNVREPLFENVARAVRTVALPKVGENGMQPPAR